MVADATQPSLTGRRVAVTRSADGAGGLADQLRARGAAVIELPLIRLLPPADLVPLSEAAAQLASYDWIVFTSAQAVRSLRSVLREAVPKPGRVAVVGPATARAVEAELDWTVDVMPATFAADAMVAAMQRLKPLAGARVLWPRAARARDALRRDLRSAGALLDDPVAYRTEMAPEMALELAQRIDAGQVDAVTFTSPLAVQCYAERATAAPACIAVIGSTTADAARAAGLPVHVQSEEHTLPALVDALARYLAGMKG